MINSSTQELAANELCRMLEIQNDGLHDPGLVYRLLGEMGAHSISFS
jgi:hypothetical protein